MLTPIRASVQDYNSLYKFSSDQYGGNIPIFKGRRRQYGSGFFGSLLKAIIPLGKKALPHVGRLVKGTVSDVIKGESLGKSLKKHGKKSVTGFVKDVLFKKSPPVKKKRKKKTQRKNVKKRKL